MLGWSWRFTPSIWAQDLRRRTLRCSLLMLLRITSFEQQVLWVASHYSAGRWWDYWSLHRSIAPTLNRTSLCDNLWWLPRDLRACKMFLSCFAATSVTIILYVLDPGPLKSLLCFDTGNASSLLAASVNTFSRRSHASRLPWQKLVGGIALGSWEFNSLLRIKISLSKMLPQFGFRPVVEDYCWRMTDILDYVIASLHKFLCFVEGELFHRHKWLF